MYLGGTYIELAINGTSGDFIDAGGGPSSTSTFRTGSGFYGRRVSDRSVGLVGEEEGFGVAVDLSVDKYKPGNP